MAHFAELGSNSKVISVHVVDDENLLDADGNAQEQIGIDYLTQVQGHTSWVQTSYNNASRKNYASIGYKYDDERDAFIPPKPFDSWALNEDTCLWESPASRPDDGEEYLWDEDSLSWVKE
tara:strand:+ start:970 stop:1329 length:360 start_codon:yes stop_codon:yes gene_type:complete